MAPGASGSQERDSMFDINNFNCPNGFRPEEYLEKIDSYGNTKDYLPLHIKKIWARMLYPQYVIRYNTLSQNEDICMREARLYCNSTDSDDNYIGYGLAHSTKEQAISGQFITNTEIPAVMLEMATGAAASAALTDAGFGLQFHTSFGSDFSSLPDSINKLTSPENSISDTGTTSLSDGTELMQLLPKEKADTVPEPLLPKNPSAALLTGDFMGLIPDIGAAAVRKMTLADIVSQKPEHLTWLYKNTKSPEIKRAIASIVQCTPEIASLFREKGISLAV